MAVAEEHVHDRAGERPVGAGPHDQGHVGLLHGGVHVDVDGDDLGAALLARAQRVRHDVDLRVHRVGAPDHDAIGRRHLARIGTSELAGAGDVASPGDVGADGRELPRIALDVAQPVDAVAHDEAHGAGVVVWPDALRAAAPFRLEKALGDEIERLVPTDAGEAARSFCADAPERMQQAVGVVDALGVARHLGADHARRVAVVLGPAHAADRASVDDLDLERAGRRAIVRTGGVAPLDARREVHALAAPIITAAFLRR